MLISLYMLILNSVAYKIKFLRHSVPTRTWKRNSEGRSADQDTRTSHISG